MVIVLPEVKPGEESTPVFSGARWRTSMSRYATENLRPGLMKQLIRAAKTGETVKPSVKGKDKTTPATTPGR